MRHLVGVAIVALIVLALPVSSAHAACKGSDIEGRWDAYAVGDDAGDGYWSSCDVRFDKKGRFRSGSSCEEDTGAESSLSGRFVVGRSCRVRGSLRQEFDDGSGRCEVAATLSSDTDTMIGVGKCDGGAIFSFSAVRR